MKVIILQYFPFLCHSLPRKSKYSLRQAVSKWPWMCFLQTYWINITSRCCNLCSSFLPIFFNWYNIVNSRHKVVLRITVSVTLIPVAVGEIFPNSIYSHPCNCADFLVALISTFCVICTTEHAVLTSTQNFLLFPVCTRDNLRSLNFEKSIWNFCYIRRC